MIYISLYSIIGSIIFMFLFLTIFYVVLLAVDLNYLMKIGPQCMLCIFAIGATRSVFWFDSALFHGMHVSVIVPELFSILRHPIYEAFTVAHLLGIIWLVGSLRYLFRVLNTEIKYYKYFVKKERSVELEAVLQEVCIEQNRKCNFFIRQAQNIESPFIIGIKDPIIILPQNVSKWSINELKLIIRHEISHYRNLHMHLLVLLEVMSAIYWWYPFIKIIKRKLKECIEMHADNAALKNVTEQKRAEYCELLVKIAEMKLQPANTLELPFSSKDFLKKRILNILSKTKENIVLKISTIVLTLVICVISVSFTILPVYDIPEDGLVLTEENSTLIYNGEVYQVFFNGELLFETENKENLPY